MGVLTSTIAINSNTHGQVVDETYHFDGVHISEYDRTKWEAHYHVAVPMIEQGLPLVIVMPGMVYGPGDTSSMRTTLIQFLQRKLPLMPQQTALAWAHVDDVVQGHILAMERGEPGETFIIAGPVHKFTEAMQIAERVTGVPAPKMEASPAVLKIMAGIMGVVGKIVPLPETMAGETLRVMAGTTYTGSNVKAKRELGYDPRPLEEGLRETLLHEMELLGMKRKGD
jgi:nucleoside-diphosphate-sugar epimerase